MPDYAEMELLERGEWRPAPLGGCDLCLIVAFWALPLITLVVLLVARLTRDDCPL